MRYSIAILAVAFATTVLAVRTLLFLLAIPLKLSPLSCPRTLTSYPVVREYWHLTRAAGPSPCQ